MAGDGGRDAVTALYLHIPFCERKCEYCDFVSVAGTRGQEEYVAVLVDEVRRSGRALRGHRIASIFCGGGTPGLLDPGLMKTLMDEVRAAFDVAPGAEITLEVNPSSTSTERAQRWREAGFNRVSMGVQSTHDDVLRFLGRVHDSGRAVAAVGELRAAGFGSLSVDLIYAVPGLDDERWQRSLETVIAAAPDHVSCYELTVEEGTPLHRSVAAGRVRGVDPETSLRQHRIAVAALAGAGYAQYEVSNFARAGFECVHNLVYWRNGHYAACGVGAHGHLPAALAPAFRLEAPGDAVAFRHAHPRSLPRYLREASLGEVEWVDAPTRDAESLMLGLRLREGARLSGAGMEEEARRLAQAGLLELRGDRATVTPRGEDVLNAVTVRLLDAAA